MLGTQRKTASRRSLRKPIRCFDYPAALACPAPMFKYEQSQCHQREATAPHEVVQLSGRTVNVVARAVFGASAVSLRRAQTGPVLGSDCKSRDQPLRPTCTLQTCGIGSPNMPRRRLYLSSRTTQHRQKPSWGEHRNTLPQLSRQSQSSVS
jgi:hypothetical protein